MRWFGKAWGAPVNEEMPHAPTPVGEPCVQHSCKRLIGVQDAGYLIPGTDGREVAYHRDCMFQDVLGPEWRKLLEPDMHRRVHRRLP